MKKARKPQGGGYPRGRGKLLCYACGTPLALHPGFGPCPLYGQATLTKRRMELVKESEATNYE